MQVPKGLVPLTLVVLVVAIACTDSPTTPYTVNSKTGRANTLGGSNIHMNIVPDANTLWVNPAIGQMVLPFIVKDLSAYVAGKLDSMAGSAGGTGAVVAGYYNTLGGINTAQWLQSNEYYIAALPQWVVMATGAVGGAITGEYKRESGSSDTVGLAWIGAGDASAHYTIIYSTACTDYNYHYAHC